MLFYFSLLNFDIQLKVDIHNPLRDLLITELNKSLTAYYSSHPSQGTCLARLKKERHKPFHDSSLSFLC